jgi:hypothetical protein
MARLIDADDFLKRLNERPVDYIDPGCDFYYFEETVESVLNETPTVDAVPVVHGRWIPTYHTYYNRAGEYQIADEWHCSNCGIYSKDEWNYCPNCGARMDLEEEEL